MYSKVVYTLNIVSDFYFQCMRGKEQLFQSKDELRSSCFHNIICSFGRKR